MWRLLPDSFPPWSTTTTFAFCFEMREGILLFSAFQAISAIFWLVSSSFTLDRWPPSEGLRGFSITLLSLNAALGCAASRLKNERCALALIVAFGLLLLSLTVDFGLGHPSECTSDAVADQGALGALAVPFRLGPFLPQDSISGQLGPARST